jgi:outer membrane protein assembly factor BamB
LSAVVAVLVLATAAGAATSWPRRSGDNQNSGAVADSALNLNRGDGLADLTVLEHQSILTAGAVNGTPAITENRLLVTSDDAGHVYVVDLDSAARLVDMPTGTSGVQSSPVLATLSSGEHRVYVGVNSAEKTLYCLNLDAIAAVRATVRNDDGSQFFCGGPNGSNPFPRSLAADGATGSGTYRASPLFAAGQSIRNPATGALQTHDVVYTATTGVGCENGQFWALDAVTGEVLWTFDPVTSGDGLGGAIGASPAMSLPGTYTIGYEPVTVPSLVYVATGGCPSSLEVRDYAESLVALDAATGAVTWFHQRRLADAIGYDTTSAPLAAVVGGPDGCQVVVSFDEDGCVYGFPQAADVPAFGDLGNTGYGPLQTRQYGPGYDAMRPGQQRLLYRKCLVPGGPGAGFSDANPALWRGVAGIDAHAQGVAIAQAAGGHVGADDSNAFAVDVCTGRVVWASSDVDNGRNDAVVVSGMLVQLGGTTTAGTTTVPIASYGEVQVLDGDSYNYANPRDSDIRGGGMYADVRLPAGHDPSARAGGPAVVNGRLYVPTSKGIDVIGLPAVRGGRASLPRINGNNVFAGPYSEPSAPGSIGGGVPLVDLYDPLPLRVNSEIRRQGAYNN